MDSYIIYTTHPSIMNPKADAILEFQRVIVQEVLGAIPEVAVDVPETDDTCELIISVSNSLAHAAFRGEGGRDPVFEDTVCDAISLYSLAVSAVRWNQCSVAADEPDMPGRLLARMISETPKASFQVKTLSNELRLAPYRGPELVNYVGNVTDGRVDYKKWASASRDPEFVGAVEAIFTRS